MKPAIIAESIQKKYDNLLAVDSIDFTISEGETFGFLGPNGAGKTTTMKMIYCFVKPTGGKLTVLGMDVVEKPRAIKAILGVVPQEDSLDPDLTVLGNLITFSRYFEIPSNIARERSVELLSMVSLLEKKDVIIENLSGGMKRRLLIARGLINDPKILILDEPTVGLDPQARHLIWEKLRILKKSGITIIITTHYMEEASRLCDRLVMMNNGIILDMGSPSDLINRHIGKEVLEIEEIDDRTRERVISALGDGISYDLHDNKMFVFSNSAGDLIGKLDRLNLGKIVKRPADLEDVFLKLTGRTLIE